jgi:hypothetical protein
MSALDESFAFREPQFSRDVEDILSSNARLIGNQRLGEAESKKINRIGARVLRQATRANLGLPTDPSSDVENVLGMVRNPELTPEQRFELVDSMIYELEVLRDNLHQPEQ